MPPFGPNSRACARRTRSEEIARWDPDLAECLKLYGDEEGWHRQLLTEFLAWIGGDVRADCKSLKRVCSAIRPPDRRSPAASRARGNRCTR